MSCDNLSRHHLPGIRRSILCRHHPRSIFRLCVHSCAHKINMRLVLLLFLGLVSTADPFHAAVSQHKLDVEDDEVVVTDDDTTDADDADDAPASRPDDSVDDDDDEPQFKPLKPYKLKFNPWRVVVLVGLLFLVMVLLTVVCLGLKQPAEMAV